jgi:hypothetical protein
MDNNVQKLTYRPNSAADVLDLPIQTFWQYVKEGKIETIKLSDRVTVVEHRELVRFIKVRRAETREAREKKASKIA